MAFKRNSVSCLIIAINMLIAIFGALMMQGVNGQGFTICNVPVEKFMVCWPALQEPSPQPPTQECCDIIKGSDEKCLCSYITSPLLPTFGIDPKLLLAIFGRCGLPNCS
ncbi:hypothetical protein vseg_003174 [Gypsophila vaccaria]